MTLTVDQFQRISAAYQRVASVLAEVVDKENTPRSMIFELSAAVGVLWTLLEKENLKKPNKEKEEAYAHKPNQRKQVPKERRLR